MKKLLSSVLAAAMLLSIPAFAADSLPFTDADYLRADFGWADYEQYTVGSKNNLCTEWPEGTLVPDSSYYSENGSRGNNSHYDSRATDITLPKSTVIIGVGFLNGHRNVESVNFKELTDLKFIDANAMGYTKISELDLSNTQVVRINHGAFGNSRLLTKIVMPSTLRVIDYSVFEACFRISDVTLNDGLERIESEAFCNYNPFQLYLPSSLVYIAENAFIGYGKAGSYKVAKGSYAEEWCKAGGRKYTYLDGTPAADTTDQPETATANPNRAKVIVDGQAIHFDSYNINGNNYFKLRDIAQVLKGTAKQFDVRWDADLDWRDDYGNHGQGAIVLTANTPYTPVGGELAAGDGAAKPCTLNRSPIFTLDGAYPRQVKMTAYTINNNNYFKLRDLGDYFDFDVSWDAGQNAVVVDTARSYNPNT